MAKIAQPWRWLPTMRPKTLVSAAPMAKIETIWIRFEIASGFSKGCAALALKKPPPLVPSILMAICEATGPTAIVCCAPSKRRGVDIGAERLRYAEIDIDQRQHDAERQQQVKGAPGHIDPEIADRLAGRLGEAADQRDGDGDAGRRGQEVLHGEAGHLHEIGHRAFAAVVLPVGVGHEAGGGVEGEPGFDGGHAGRIEGQAALQPLQEVKHQETGQVEEQQSRRIGGPVLLLTLAGSRDAIKAPLDRAENRREECAVAAENAIHVAAERLHEQNDDPAIDEDLYPSVESHRYSFPCLRQLPLETFWANEGVCQVGEKEQGHSATEDIVDKHVAILPPKDCRRL